MAILGAQRRSLRDSGVSDEVIQAIIISGSHLAEKAERDKAWQMLYNMGLITDQRSTSGQ